MRNIFQTLKRPFIWIIRIRHRCGYGVHSPFAFNFITHVLYERSSYYAYKSIRSEERNAYKNKKEKKDDSLRVRKLLYRLVDYNQPLTIIDAGKPSSSSFYIKNACSKAHYIQINDIKTPINSIHTPLFVYIHWWQEPTLVETFFEKFILSASEDSLFVIQGIFYSSSMRKLWKKLKSNARVGITFDLYDIGIIFFDLSKNKQHYKINF